ncbi:hypothetical protein AB836_00680 [Rickettsiales bacterium (ex Bugula neritina AB1)]|nr:hypothetical protein AB836_00680 [Rickettsiales bacterium (ex Bugula neritina AB1)]
MIRIIRKYIPSLCIYCYKFQINGVLCSDCWSKIQLLPYNYCLLCNNFFFNFECENCNLRTIGVFQYNKIISHLILQFKYNNNIFIGKIFINFLKKIYFSVDNLKIIYIPNYFTKQITHNYNSSLLMSEIFANQNSNITILHNVLKKNTIKRQKDAKNYKERSLTKDAFSLKEKAFRYIENQNILILDDVITTGNTIKYISNLIKSCNPKTLQSIVISKVIL